MRRTLSGNLMLLVTAMVWGLSFVSQTVGMEHIGPFTFQSTRYFLGGLVLLPVIFYRDRRGLSPHQPANGSSHRFLLLSGLLCGTLLFAACSLQQVSLVYIPAGKSAFISTLYILLVPFAGILLHQRVRPVLWLSIALALPGLYLLCGGGRFSIGTGELLCLGSALGFTFHIVAVGMVSSRVDGVRLSCLQFLVCSVLSAAFMIALETPGWPEIRQSWLPICYSGIISAGLGYTLQIIGQSRTNPAMASLLMSLESVFATVFSWLLLGQHMDSAATMGCILMFSAILLTQLPERRAKT